MTELKKPSAETIALMGEYHRQCVSGEYAARYWQWALKESAWEHWGNSGMPSFRFDVEYRYSPAPAHPHYATFGEWEAHKASGAVERGEVEVLRKTEALGKDCEPHWTRAPTPQWYIDSEYKIRKTDKHPDNRKPALEQLDWSQVPVGMMTCMGVILAASSNVIVVFDAVNVQHIYPSNWSHLRINKTKKWTALQDNQAPPVCEGLVMEYRYCAADTYTHKVGTSPHYACINAYRVIGLAPGYTDGGVV